MSILKTIQSPGDLKRLSPTQFPALCQELREQIIGVVANVGGHLASNLGVVELTVALHYLLNTPPDDAGHGTPLVPPGRPRGCSARPPAPPRR